MTLGRNDPCHCGSGRKYKRCCLDCDIGYAPPEEWPLVRALVTYAVVEEAWPGGPVSPRVAAAFHKVMGPRWADGGRPSREAARIAAEVVIAQRRAMAAKQAAAPEPE